MPEAAPTVGATGSLIERAEKLRAVQRELASGDLLRPVLTRAADTTVWGGPLQMAFLGWARALDNWVRVALAEGTGIVAGWLDARARAVEEMAKQMAAGMAPPPLPPPSPLNHGIVPPPPFRIDPAQLKGQLSMDAEKVRDLANQLGATGAQGVTPLAMRVRDVVGDGHQRDPSLPPDAPDAAGFPKAYETLKQELAKAAADLGRRAQAILGDVSTGGPGIDLSGLAASADAAARSAADAAGAARSPLSEGAAPVAGPPAPAEVPPRSPEDIEKARRRGKDVAERVADLVGAKHFDDEEHEKLFAALARAERSAEDPQFALAFLDAFIPDGMQKWCKLMSRSNINLQKEMDILRPVSRFIGTATRAGDEFPPETRKALLSSPCLDTLVHGGNFDTKFALGAFHRIMDDPGRYHRVDGSDRVYSELDREGHYKKGDARTGAFAILANNAEAAQRIVETRGPHGRKLLLDALDDDGTVGRKAAAALEAGLKDLTQPASEDTLELVLRKVAHGGIDPSAATKEALARLLSSKAGVERMLGSASDGLADSQRWSSDDDGFRVPLGTLESVFGKILDDKTARKAMLAGLAKETTAQFQGAAASIGQKQLAPPYESELNELKNSIRRFGDLFQAAGAGVEAASGKKEQNAFLSAGLSLVIDQAVGAIPGGYAGKFIFDKTLETAGGEGLDLILNKAEEDRIKTLDKAQLVGELNRNTRYLVQVAILGDKGVTDQLVPADSPLRQRWMAPDGHIKVPTPPLPGLDAKDWHDFNKALDMERDRGSPIGKVLLELDDWSETFRA